MAKLGATIATMAIVAGLVNFSWLVAVAVAVVVALAVVVGLVVQFPWESQVGFIVEHLEIPLRLPLVKERFEPVIVVPGVAGLLVVVFFFSAALPFEHFFFVNLV